MAEDVIVIAYPSRFFQRRKIPGSYYNQRGNYYLEGCRFRLIFGGQEYLTTTNRYVDIRMAKVVKKKYPPNYF